MCFSNAHTSKKMRLEKKVYTNICIIKKSGIANL